VSQEVTDLYALSEEARGLLFTEARTGYKFTGELVGDEHLAAIWDLLKWAPTASNVSPLRILYVRSPEAKERLLPFLTPPNRLQSATAPVVAVLAMDTDFAEHVPVLTPGVPGLREAFRANDAAREQNATFNATLQAAYFLLAVRAVGLHAGPMKGFDPAGVDGEFFPDGRWKSILVVNVGMVTEDGTRERAPRLSFEQAVRVV
jgi:3-hydroxypropanoate dehydrogenase